MAGAAGGFVSRAFDSMLKECSGKKYAPLRKAIQTYTEGAKEISQQSISGKENQVLPLDGVESSTRMGDESEKIDSKTSEDMRPDNEEIGITSSVKATLSNAGQTLDDSEADILLNPLKIAFETKNLKVIELALDCLHKLIAYDHLEGDPGLEHGKNSVLFTAVLEMVCNCVDNSSPDSTVLQVLKALLTSVSSTKFRVHGEPLIGVIRVCYNIALNSKSGINQSTSKAMLTQILSIIFRRLEADLEYPPDSIKSTKISSDVSTSSVELDSSSTLSKHVMGTSNSPNEMKEAALASLEELQSLAGAVNIKGLEAAVDKVVQIENSEKTVRGIEFEGLTVAQTDASMLFHTLCKMSMKEDTDEVTTKTRILSLELLQGLLEGVDSFFNKNVYFVDSMKAYLSYTLLRTAVSRSPVIFKYAIGMLAVLLLRFREHLKGEIGIFFPLIILRSLDALDFPIGQRIAVLKMLENICKSPQTLVDLFVNYDCVLEAENLFEHMVTSLSKIAQGLQNAEPNMVVGSQMGSVKSYSLQCLVNVLKSLVGWEKTHRHFDKHNKVSTSLENDLSPENLAGLEKREGESIMFEKAKAHKTTIEAAISEFNREPGKGVQYLIENGLVEQSAHSVALFLRNNVGLDKAMIGDYLGQPEEFPLSVMHAYANSMNFSGMKFASSLREYLSGFRLPGEAQKIDRIMEKFAERYCADNPGLFQNADTAYVLAYAVIMLNTDAHNPMVSPKMSKLDFIHMNAMNDTELCAPTELLEEIYDSIVTEEIKLKEDSVGTRNTNRQKQGVEEKQGLIGILNLAIPKHKSSVDPNLESVYIVKQVQAVLRKQGTQRVDFYTSHRTEVVRPMIEAVGWPLLATFSVTMEEGENKSRVGFCMDGFRAVIHITQVLGMDTMRYAFLTSLIRFNFLHAPKDIRSKNVEALRTLLSLCDSEIDSFQDTWNAVLECISRLERITSSPSISATVMHGSNQISRDSIVQSLRELAGKSSEQLFINSVQLPSDSVVEFFTALCGVSAEEMKQTPPRVFSLQKLVEISYYNMARIRMVWARIWSVLSIHFVSAGSHPDTKISMYAIDSLRQLSMKYLERPELANFTFQNDILKPFVVLIRNSRNDSIRRLIVDCIVQMIKSKVGNIKSGWKSVFMIFTAAADDEKESTVESAFENVEQVILEHFDQVIGDCFMDCVNCLIAFSNSKSSHRISLKAIALLRICEDRLAEGLIPGGALKPIHLNADVSYDVTEHYWFPMLAGLSDLTSDARTEVRSCALEVLFDLLNERGKKFSTPFWESIFHRVLFPIFDNVRYAGKEKNDPGSDGWICGSSIHSLQLLCTLFSTFYKEVCFMLPSLLGLLLDCAKKTDQKVVSISLGALVHLIEVGGHKFSENDWDTLLNSIRDASYTTQPLELLNDMGLEYSKGHEVLVENKDIYSSSSFNTPVAEVLDNHHIDATHHVIADQTTPGVNESKVPSTNNSNEPSQAEQSHSEVEPLPQNKTISQKIMGNVMDSLFLRTLTNRPQEQSADVPSIPSTSDEINGFAEPVIKSEPENSLLSTVRAKAVTQLLLLGTIDSIQKKFWDKLKQQQKIFIMDILVSMLEFSAIYNSYAGLRMRMNHIPSERPPLNLLRQELEGTRIYLEILQRTTSDSNETRQLDPENDGTLVLSSNADDSHQSEDYDGSKLGRIAENKLVSFCEQILKEASLIQSGNTNKTEVHRVVELRSPIVIKVLQSMTTMNSDIFKKHLREFYPWITKLVCCDQVDVRVAVGDVFTTKVTPLLAVTG